MTINPINKTTIPTINPMYRGFSYQGVSSSSSSSSSSSFFSEGLGDPEGDGEVLGDPEGDGEVLGDSDGEGEVLGGEETHVTGNFG